MKYEMRRRRRTTPTVEAMEERLSLSGVGAVVGTVAASTSQHVILLSNIPDPLLPVPPDSVGP